MMVPATKIKKKMLLFSKSLQNIVTYELYQSLFFPSLLFCDMAI